MDEEKTSICKIIGCNAKLGIYDKNLKKDKYCVLHITKLKKIEDGIYTLLFKEYSNDIGINTSGKFSLSEIYNFGWIFECYEDKTIFKKKLYNLNKFLQYLDEQYIKNILYKIILIIKNFESFFKIILKSLSCQICIDIPCIDKLHKCLTNEIMNMKEDIDENMRICLDGKKTNDIMNSVYLLSWKEKKVKHNNNWHLVRRIDIFECILKKSHEIQEITDRLMKIKVNINYISR